MTLQDLLKQKEKEWKKKYRKEYYEKHRSKALAWQKKYRQENKEKMRKYRKGYYQKNKERVKKQHIEWNQKNKEKAREHKRRWREKNPNYSKKYWQIYRQTSHKRLEHSMSTAIRVSLCGRKSGRKWETLIGYSLQDLINHLETQFDKNMSWNNYGSYWEIDHYIPKSWFIYETPNDIGFKMCWDLNNLQPLTVKVNRTKFNNLPSRQTTRTKSQKVS